MDQVRYKIYTATRPTIGADDPRYFPYFLQLKLAESEPNIFCRKPGEIMVATKPLDFTSRRRLLELLIVDFNKLAAKERKKFLKAIYTNWSTGISEKLANEPVAFELDILNNKAKKYPAVFRPKATTGNNIVGQYIRLDYLKRRLRNSVCENDEKIKIELCAFAQKITSDEYQAEAIKNGDILYIDACNAKANAIWDMYPDCRPKK